MDKKKRKIFAEKFEQAASESYGTLLTMDYLQQQSGKSKLSTQNSFYTC